MSATTPPPNPFGKNSVCPPSPPMDVGPYAYECVPSIITLLSHAFLCAKWQSQMESALQLFLLNVSVRFSYNNV